LRKLNALVGQEIPGMSREEQLELARENVAWAAGRAAEYGVEVLVEAVNVFENGPYLLYTTRDAASLPQERRGGERQAPVRLLPHAEDGGEPGRHVREHIGEIGHVQVADSPARGEPGTGEIHYPYVLDVLEELGY
jgi:hydroxypyruvate isomerase